MLGERKKRGRGEKRRAIVALYAAFGEVVPIKETPRDIPDERDYEDWGQKKRHREIRMCLMGR